MHIKTSCTVRHSPSHPLKCKWCAAAGRRRRILMASCHRRKAMGRSQPTEASATSKTNSSSSSPFRLELKCQIGPHKNDEQFNAEFFPEKNSWKLWRWTNHQEKRHFCTVRLSNQNTLFTICDLWKSCPFQGRIMIFLSVWTQYCSSNGEDYWKIPGNALKWLLSICGFASATLVIISIRS